MVLLSLGAANDVGQYEAKCASLLKQAEPSAAGHSREEGQHKQPSASVAQQGYNGSRQRVEAAGDAAASPTPQLVEPGRKPQRQARAIVAAWGEGVKPVAVPAVVGVSGNVHTGATPPWLLGSTVDVAAKAAAKVAAHSHARGAGTAVHGPAAKKRRVNPRKLRSADVGVVPGSHVPAGWLPNFGGVWQTRSRAASQRAFREKMKRSGVAVGTLQRKPLLPTPRVREAGVGLVQSQDMTGSTKK